MQRYLLVSDLQMTATSEQQIQESALSSVSMNGKRRAGVGLPLYRAMKTWATGKQQQEFTATQNNLKFILPSATCPLDY